MVMLQSLGYFQSGAIGNMLALWEQAGFFSYVIPFLLIFALIFGILTQIKLFRDNRTINAIIALAVSLMSLQFNFVPRFFSEIFPRLGVGLAIILIVIILTGLFVNPEDKWQMYLMWGLGAVIVIVILIQTAGVIGWYSFLPWLGYNWPTLLAFGIFIVVIIVIIAAGRDRKNTPMKSIFSELLREGAK